MISTTKLVFHWNVSLSSGITSSSLEWQGFILLEHYRACFLAEIVTLPPSFLCFSSEGFFLTGL